MRTLHITPLSVARQSWPHRSVILSFVLLQPEDLAEQAADSESDSDLEPIKKKKIDKRAANDSDEESENPVEDDDEEEEKEPAPKRRKSKKGMSARDFFIEEVEVESDEEEEEADSDVSKHILYRVQSIIQNQDKFRP